MNPDDHSRDDALDLLALGAAGALSEAEYRELDELLATDPELAHEYAELQASASTLAEVASEPPPPRLRAAVLDAIRDVEQLPGQAAEPGTTEATPSPGDPTVEELDPIGPPDVHPAPANVVPIHHRRWMLPATAAAAVVILLVGGLIIRNVADAPTDRTADVLNQDDAVTIPLTGTLDGLRLVTSDRADAAVLLGSDLEPPTTGTVFQLWAIRDDEPVGMGTFLPDNTGDVEVVIDDAAGGAEWAVTVEPEGGSDQPTSDPIAVSPGLA